MEQKEILEYVSEGSALLFIYGFSTYATIILLPLISSLFSRKINSQNELDKIIEEESQKLKLKGVKGILQETTKSFCCMKNETPIIVVGGLGATRGAVKHELYHIFKGDLNKKYSEVRYWLLEEPRACLYDSFGIKI